MKDDEEAPTTSSDYLGTNTNEPDHKSTSSIPMSMPMEQETRVRLSFCIKFQ